MNITLKADLFIAGRKESLGSDGKTSFYSLAVVTEDGDAGNLSCGREIYEMAEPMKKYTATCVYRDGQYKNLRIVGIQPEDAGTDPGRGKKHPAG